jgi:hypothetical protein
MKTVPEPAAIVSGGPTQVHISPTFAAGIPPIITVGVPGGITGPPTCGTVPVTIGQTCMSPTLAAIGIILRFFKYYNFREGLCPCDPNSFFVLTQKRNQKKSRLCSLHTKNLRLTTKIF